MIEPSSKQVAAALIAYASSVGDARLGILTADHMAAIHAAIRAALNTGGDMCEARQFSDQMLCGRCGLGWDTNDPDPPACGKTIDRRAIPERRVTKAAMQHDPHFAFTSGAKEPLRMSENDRRFVALVSTLVPVDLFDAQALEMAELYEKQRAAGIGAIEAMKAAYRLFLDRLP